MIIAILAPSNRVGCASFAGGTYSVAGVSSREVAKWAPMPVAFSAAETHPLIEGVADGAALGLVFDDDEADEVAARERRARMGFWAEACGRGRRPCRRLRRIG